MRANGVDTDRRVLVFQSRPHPPNKTAELLKELKAYQQRVRCEVAMLPLGWCHGDGEYLKRLEAESGGIFKYVGLSAIFDVLSVLVAGDIFLGTSLHGNITAFSFGIPHVFGPIEVAKREGFLEIAGLPAELKMDSWTQLNQKLDFASGLGPEFFATRAAVPAKERVHQVFDLLIDAIKDTRTVSHLEVP